MKIKSILLQHLKNDEPGILPEILLARNHSVSCLYAGEEIDKKAANADLLILLGGPMSVNQETLYPFISKEIEILRKRIKIDLPTLGICLGAQMIAKAAGSPVYLQSEQECGWASLKFTNKGKFSCLQYLEKTPVFHWHKETFDLPAKGELLTSTSLCPNQAFSLGDKILAVQFHIEVNEKKIELLTGDKNYPTNLLSDLKQKSKLTLNTWLDSVHL